MVTYLKPDILGCDVKLALGSIAMSKGSGGGIPAEVFHILKDDDAVEVLPSICPHIGKLGRTGKSQFSLQSQRRAMTKNVQTTAGLISSHMAAK